MANLAISHFLPSPIRLSVLGDFSQLVARVRNKESAYDSHAAPYYSGAPLVRASYHGTFPRRIVLALRFADAAHGADRQFLS